jgi:hypothetical protein
MQMVAANYTAAHNSLLCSLSDLQARTVPLSLATTFGRQWQRDKCAPASPQEHQMSQSPNRILNSLPQNIFAAVEPQLRIVNLPFGYVIAEN